MRGCLYMVWCFRRENLFKQISARLQRIADSLEKAQLPDTKGTVGWADSERPVQFPIIFKSWRKP